MADGVADVVLDGVSIRFPRRAEPVLRGVDLRTAPGEEVLVLGASGSGKSTVLHTISGVVPHSVTADLRGTVTVAGTRTTDTTVVDLSRRVGVLPQDPSAAVCLPDVEQELALPLENRAVDPAAIGPAIDAALEVVGAAHLRHRATAELSGGESQRVALAAALVGQPSVLLLDEPTSMLDPDGVADVRRALSAAVARHRPAVVLVEHRLDDLAGAAGIAGLPARAVVLGERGEVLADGPTADVLHDHAARLHAAGSWLPLEAELAALTGVAGGLAAAPNADLLERLADDGNEGARPADHPGPRADPVLVTRGLAVDRPRPRRSPGPGRRTAAPPPQPPLLRAVDLAVRPGEVVALLGRNGIGKSTLLLTLAGLLPPAAGTVDGPRPGMVFQNAEHQFVAHTVAAEIGHGLAEPVAPVVDRALRTHRLSHLTEQNPFRLSGGEKRRVSLAAMLAHDRSCLLADEPTLGLDRRDTIATIGALRAAADDGRAVVLASHDLRTVLTLADRAVVLADGAVIADGPVTEVLSDPTVLTRAGLTLPPLVDWLLTRVGTPAAVRRALDRLDAAVTSGRALRTAGAPR
ncbi:ABC transporter ATP-binding protein [Georgenia sunbinii]|uniref:ABC transporter ATP-binding protein n=1 Tax=Georgenia sunbinii TaxID=3117728 RepID=UPI002F26A15D